MEKITLKSPIQLVAKQVKSFPLGIAQTFDALPKTLPNGMERAYYGISWMENDKIIYYAAAEQKENAEINQYALEPWTIESGDYLSVPIINWRDKLDTIKAVFHNLKENVTTDKTKPCIEWYQSDEKMLFMIRTIEN